MKNVRAIFIILCLTALSTLSGCLNVQQTTVINEDGSGTIDLHYWMRSLGDIGMGDEVGGYSFIESEVREKYKSSNSQITDLKKYDVAVDTTKHFELKISFKNINNLSEAPGFAKVKVSYTKGKDGMDFKYVLPQDTSLQKRYIQPQNKLEYTFVFPKEVMATNGVKEDTKEGNVVKWTIPIEQVADNDVEMTATIKEKSGICGMFGFELPFILSLGLIFFQIRKKKDKKLNQPHNLEIFRKFLKSNL